MAMPNPFQKLKHGALLCKKNFNTFVETFNFLVDFAQNIKGDGDANGNGTIVFDRTVPDRPVIRSKINMDYPFGEKSEQKKPWEFHCTIDPDTQERTGGWTNGRVQIGYETRYGTPDIQGDPLFQVLNSNETSDGYHSLKVNVSSKVSEVVVDQGAYRLSDLTNNIVCFPIGYVSNGELIVGVHTNPICYILL